MMHEQSLSDGKCLIRIRIAMAHKLHCRLHRGLRSALKNKNARTPMTPADVLKLITEKEAKFADLRFTDTIGKEHHVTIPTRLGDAGVVKDGKMLDGSSIAGWKGINESDMILMPDPATAVID